MKHKPDIIKYPFSHYRQSSYMMKHKLRIIVKFKESERIIQSNEVFDDL